MSRGIAAAVLAAGVFAASSAQALILDLTRAGLVDQTAAEQTTAIVVDNGPNSVTFVLTAGTGGPVTFQNAFPTGGPLPSFCGLLACDFGGAGIRNNVIFSGERLSVRLSQADIDAGYSISAQEFFFLNLVLSSPMPPGQTAEAALVRYNAGDFDEDFAATDTDDVGELSTLATSGDAVDTIGVLLDAGQTGLGGAGRSGDFSLAGIRFELLLNGEPVEVGEEVPLPASALLLLSAMGGLAVIRRRRRADA